MCRWITRLAPFLLFLLTLLLPAVATARDPKGEIDDSDLRDLLRAWLDQRDAARPKPCEKNCFVLSSMTLHGTVGEPLSFVLKGAVLASGAVTIPLFGPSAQVRIGALSLDGAAPTIGFENDQYFALIGGPRAFELRGTLTLGEGEMLTIAGPLVSLDAKLDHGRIVEGESLSGLSSTTLHFDPMTPESQSEAESKTPKVFRLSRAVRFGKETGFVYRLVMSQGKELGTVQLPLHLGEKVREVSGAPGWTVEGKALLLPVAGRDADVTISGVLSPDSARDGMRVFAPDERSAYEWWLVESDPDLRVELGGEGKLVDNGQSPIPPTLPTARTFLVQRGERLEVTATSLVRGEVLAAVARTERRFVSVTPSGEVIGDESITYDNNGLDHLTVVPAGQPIYASTDSQPGRILHTRAGSREMLVPLLGGVHVLRVQTLSQQRVWPLLGVLSFPASDHPLTTGSVEVTVGLPGDVFPLAMLGGDHAGLALARGDLVAVVLGALFACFAFRTRRTRALGAVATAGLWFISKEVFVLASAALFFAGALFLATRFFRGNRLLGAGAAAFLVAMFGARATLQGDPTEDATHGILVPSPTLPQPESNRAASSSASAPLDMKAGVTPVSLSTPSSERYARASRQLVTSQRPFVPRIVYATQALFTGLELLWLGVVGMLVYAHRPSLTKVIERVRERLARRAPEPAAPAAEAFPRFR